MPPEALRSRTPAWSRAVTSPCTVFTSRPTRRAASRIEMGPAPHKALSSSQRRAVRTFHNSSGVSKLIRAVFWARPLSQARAKSSAACWRDATSRITVFTVPPLDIRFKICEQLARACKPLRRKGRSAKLGYREDGHGCHCKERPLAARRLRRGQTWPYRTLPQPSLDRFVPLDHGVLLTFPKPHAIPRAGFDASARQSRALRMRWPCWQQLCATRR